MKTQKGKLAKKRRAIMNLDMTQADFSEVDSQKSWYPLLWLVLILIILWRLV